ncbi:penicillin acylase family protein [Candidatus Palauibacter sp.]|uniref:penicillin acylase family protein n=1 Tax=Candidatus Palauibacter sp. TaxID=3101350 RepID=UPI003B02C853
MRLRGRAGAVLAALAIAGGLVATSLFFYLQRSIQPRSGEHTLDGLSGAASVAFDEWAIPSISATTELDAMRVQGFIHASERLWQLEFFQRVARGRLAEVFGEAALEADRLMRTLDVWSVTGRELETATPSDRALLEAYAQGVNARIESWRGPWPPEFLILGIDPQRWSAQASLSIGRIMALDLTEWRTELSRTSALATLDADRRPALGAGYPAWGPTILQDTLPAGTPPPRLVAIPDAQVPALAAASTSPGAATISWHGLSLLDFGFRASNSWALAGSRTADGYPLLANDPHLSLRAPSTWYLNSLAWADPAHAVAGLSIPGVPGVVIGLNRDVAWAFTNAMVDDADFIVEGTNLDRSMYRDSDGWRPFETRTEEISVRGREEPERWVVRTTVRGPVITDLIPAGGLTLSMLWTGFEPVGAVTALGAMNRARNPTAFDEAVVQFRSPHQNVIYATATGEIGYRMGGSVPERAPGEGALPISFERLPAGWTGFRPPEAMPALRGPASGYLVSANNLQSRPSYGRVGIDYPAPFRARRLDDLISAASAWTVEDMRATQLDSRSLWAERYRPRAVDAARRAGLDSLASVLQAWDLTTEVGALGAAPFYTWLYRLRELLVADEFPHGRGWFPDLAFMEIVENEVDAWIDDPRTPRVETLARLEEEAARTAARTLGSAWGEVHRERSAHPLGSVALLDRLFGFHVGPYPSRGGRHTVRPEAPSLRSRLDSTSWRLPVVSEYGPSARFVARAAPGEMTGHFLIPTGQAGNPLDPHYRDMAAVWSESRLIEIRPGTRPEGTVDELHFRPGDPPPPPPDTPRFR